MEHVEMFIHEYHIFFSQHVCIYPLFFIEGMALIDQQQYLSSIQLALYHFFPLMPPHDKTIFQHGILQQGFYLLVGVFVPLHPDIRVISHEV